MKDGFKRTESKPIHLEATKARTRDIYARFGFEVSASLWMARPSKVTVMLSYIRLTRSINSDEGKWIPMG